MAAARAAVSALTVLGLDEWRGRYASYEALADEVRARFTEPRATLRELTLTPAFDICPLPRTGGEASHAMAIGRDGYRLSRVAACVEQAATYLLTEEEAREIVDAQIETIETKWAGVCALAQLSEVDRGRLRRGALLEARPQRALQLLTRVALSFLPSAKLKLARARGKAAVEKPLGAGQPALRKLWRRPLWR